MLYAVPDARVILATASRWRAKLLEDTGLTVVLVPAPIDEEAVRAADAVSLAAARAAAKADAVWRLICGQGPSSGGEEAGLPELGVIVIGADQVAHIDGEPFGKPLNPDDHRARLRSLRGRTHVLSTGVAFRGSGVVSLGQAADFVEHTGIRFRADVTDAEIDAYVASGDGSGCAGGYRAEGPGAWLIAGVEGDWSNVIGLPVFGVLDRLRRCGVRVS